MADRPAKAEGMQWVNPYIIVKDLKSALEFYEKVFGFEIRMTLPDKEGNPMHAEMQHKDSIIMLGSESPESQTKSPGTLGGSSSSFYVYVDDINGFFDKIKGAVAKVYMEPTDQFWGDRMCHVEDPEGHQWSFAQNVADFDPSKVPG
jgi:uncharacterized glyoxalase superfamily protein PhnB